MNPVPGSGRVKSPCRTPLHYIQHRRLNQCNETANGLGEECIFRVRGGLHRGGAVLPGSWLRDRGMHCTFEERRSFFECEASIKTRCEKWSPKVQAVQEGVGAVIGQSRFRAIPQQLAVGPRRAEARKVQAEMIGPHV
jgi:hypothetical protein